MQSATKSITLMLMKVKILQQLLFVVLASVGFLLLPNFASSAHAEAYLFYYNKDDVAVINRLLYSNDLNKSPAEIRNTSVWMKGFDLFGQSNKPIPFVFERVNAPTKQLVYQYEYHCKLEPPYPRGEWDVTLWAFVGPLNPGPVNAWTNKEQIPGQITLADDHQPLTVIPNKCFPSGINQQNKSVNTSFANYQKTNKDNWPGVKSSTAVSEEQNRDQNSDSGDSGDAEAECTAPGFGWFVCGAIKYFQTFTEWVEDSVIAPLFETKPLSFDTDESTNPQYAAWNATRAIANVFFVLVFLVVIFASIFGLQAYNVKKILPKLVVAAILIQASYFMMAAAIDITNVLGKGLREIMTSVTPAVNYTGGSLGGFITLGAGALIAAALAAKIAAVGIIAGALPLAIGLLAVLITLVLRQTLIVLAILTAPIAIVSMVLPNTERFFRSWANLFIKLILMYPMIILLFAAGRFAAYATLSNSTALSPISPIIAMLCMALPLLAVPFTFSWAGGIMSKVSSGVFKGGAKVDGLGQDKLKGWREDAKRRDTLRANPNLSFRNDGWRALNPRRRKQNWMAGGGFFYNSANAKRKIGESQEKYLSQDEKAYSRLYDNLVRNGQDGDSLLEKIANGKAGSFGFKNDQGAVNFAVGKLAQNKQFDTLRAAKRGKNSGAVNAAIKNSFSDIHKAAPDITTGNLDSIDTLSAAGLADLDHTTLQAYLNGGNAAQQAQRAEHIGKLVVDAHADDQLRNKFNNGKLLGVIHQVANGQGGNQLGTHTQQIQQIVQQVAPGQQGAAGTARFI